MSPRSSAEYRSNIYPTFTKGNLYNDRKFLDAISDSEALDILWHFGGTHGSKLNPLQKRQHDMAKHCMYAEKGDYPWGTPVGSKTVVCLCDRVDCPLYLAECSKFHPEGFKPQPMERRSTSSIQATSKPKKEVQRNRPASAKKRVATSGEKLPRVARGASAAGMKPTSTRASIFTPRPASKPASKPAPKPVSKPAPVKKPKVINHKPWTAGEDAILMEMYPLYGISLRKWTKTLPGRNAEQILDRAHELKVRYVPQRERGMYSERPKARVSRNPSSGRASRNTTGSMTRAEKKKRREAKRNRPWDSSEDATLRRNYPLHGSNMNAWDRKLQYRTKDVIEKRAWELGLRTRKG